jgi:hypothetical protein
MFVQVNYPSDSRAILKAVLQSTELVPNVYEVAGRAVADAVADNAEETGQEPADRSPRRAPPPRGVCA